MSSVPKHYYIFCLTNKRIQAPVKHLEVQCAINDADLFFDKPF